MIYILIFTVGILFGVLIGYSRISGIMKKYLRHELGYSKKDADVKLYEILNKHK